MGATQSSVQKCLVVLRVNDTSICFPCLSPFVHAITKYNSIPIQSEDDIKKMAAQRHLDLEIFDLRNSTTKHLSVSTPLGIGVKFCSPRLLELKVLEVEKGSPAERKIAEDDFVIGIENFYFETNDEFFYAIYRNKGSLLNFIVYRNSQVRRVPIELNIHEPFLGAVFGEGILMTAGKSGDVINIGTQTECKFDDNRTLSEDVGKMQNCAEKMVDSGLQDEKDMGRSMVDASNIEHEQYKNSSAERMEEQIQDEEKQSSDIKNTQLDKTGENSHGMPSEKENAVEYNTTKEDLFSGTNSSQRVNETSCGEGIRREVAIEEPCDPKHVEATCNYEENIRQNAENVEPNSAFNGQQPAIPMENKESQKSTAKYSSEISEHTHINNEANAQYPHCQAASADYAHRPALENSEIELEGNTNACPIVGEYSNEDKIKLLEALTGTKNESMSESG